MDRARLSSQIRSIAATAEELRDQLRDQPENSRLREALARMLAQLSSFTADYERSEQAERDRAADITTTNQALSDANEHLRVVFDSIKDHAVFTLSPDGIITTWNSGAERLFGWTELEGIGQPGALIFTPEDRELGAPEQEIDQALTREYSQDIRWHIRKDGSRFFADGMMRQLRGPDDLLRGLIKVTRDATGELERQQAREAIAEDLADMQILQQLSLRLVSENDLQVFYDAILDAAITLTRADAGTVQLLDESSQELLLIATRGFGQAMTTHFSRIDASSNTSCGIALATGERTFVDFDVPQEADPDGSLRMHVAAGYYSAQSTPLVARTGRPLGMFSTHWQRLHRPSDRELRFLDILARQAADLIEQQQAERLLRANEARQTFLLRLTDALRQVTDPVEIQAEASRILGEYLGVSRVIYADIEGEEVVIHVDYVSDVPSMRGRYQPADFGEGFVEAFRRGEIIVIEDIETFSGLEEAERAIYRSMQIRAFCAAVLAKESRWVAGFAIHANQPRAWTQDEVNLMLETAERTWTAVERGRAEEALRRSEASERAQRMLAERLRDTAAELSSTLKLQEVLDRAVTSAHRLIGSDAAYVVLTENGRFTHFQSHGLSTKEKKGLHDWHAELDSQVQGSSPVTSPYLSSVQQGQLTLINDRATARSLLLPLRPVHALLIVPLWRQEGAFGYLVLIRRRGAFGEADVTAVEAFSYHLVTAISNARLFVQAQELAALQERQQLARDLHDAVSQTLFTASIIIESLPRLMEQNSIHIPHILLDANRLIKGAQAEMRTLLLELRPRNLLSTSLHQLLSQLIDAVKGRKRTEFALEFEGEPTLPEAVHIAVYRIAQEALNNITKHADARHVWVSGRGGVGYIELQIRDSGAGFAVERPSAGMGLQMMRERAAEIDADLLIQSHPGIGTEITLRWPGAGE